VPPAALLAPAYAHVWTGNVNVAGRPTVVPGAAPVPGKVKAKSFVTYIEVLEQGAHDPAIRAIAVQRGMQPRPMHAGRVRPLNVNPNPLAYYAAHGPVAAGIVSAYMTRTWTANPNVQEVFVRNRAVQLAVQAQRQANGYSYEVTMWYDVAVVYVAFHCYYNQ
jgi:hypothetical protein